MGCQFHLTPGAGVSDSPLGNQGMSGFRLHVAIYKMDLVRIWAHMQKIGQKIQDWARYQNFRYFINWDFASPWLTKITITCLILMLQDQNLTCKPIFSRRKGNILRARS